MDCEGFGGATVPTQESKDRQNIRDLLHRHGLDVGVHKDVHQVVFEVLSAFLQTVPKDQVRSLLASVDRSITTPSPTTFSHISFGRLGSPMDRIPEGRLC